MKAPAKCPQCGTALQPDWESCPNCPMSFQDAPPEKSAFQNDTFRNFGIPLMIFGGLAWALWTFSQYMWRTAEDGTKTVTTSLKNAATTGSPTRSGTVPTDSQSIHDMVLEHDGVDQEGKRAASAPGSEPAEEQGPGTISIMPEKPVARPKAVVEWKMRGTIYDLLTLQPVPGVHMIFTDNVTNSKAQIKTDEQGRYKVLLPSLQGRGYLVTLSKTGYEKSYLDPGTEGVSDMPLERREEICRELSSLIAEPASLQPNGGTPLITDFHMAPKRP